MAEVSLLDALLDGEPVRTLTRLRDDRTIFAFNQSDIEDENRLTLSLGINGSLGGLTCKFRPLKN